jgi:hypothetical protein
MVPLKQLRQLAFGISLEEATFARRGFRRNNVEAQQRLEQIGYTFLHGYHAAAIKTTSLKPLSLS